MTEQCPAGGAVCVVCGTSGRGLIDGVCARCARCAAWGQPPPTATFRLSDDDDLACMDCSRLLPPGAPIGESHEAMDGDTAVVSLKCVYCAMGLGGAA